MGKQYPIVLTIAGSDSGGGAGIQADLKAISACGAFGMSAITAVTSQNTVGVQGIYALPPKVVESQIEAVLSDIGADAVKIGMLGSPEIASLTARLLRKYNVRQVVLDPVLVATSGDRLSAEATVDVILRELLSLATVITPNIMEAEILSGLRITSPDDYAAVWHALQAAGAQSLLLKGGHGTGPELHDTLFTSDHPPLHFLNPRIETVNTHGTGCTLSSAIAAFLARGFDLSEASGRAIAYLHQAIAHGAEFSIGHGHGPVHHFWNLPPQ